MRDPRSDVTHPDRIEFALSAEVSDRALQVQLGRTQPSIGDFASFLLVDEVEPRESAELGLDRATPMESSPASGALELLQALRSELRSHIRIRCREPLAGCNQRLAPTTDVSIVAAIKIGPPRAALLAPVHPRLP